jgi:hypothetical protein
MSRNGLPCRPLVTITSTKNEIFKSCKVTTPSTTHLHWLGWTRGWKNGLSLLCGMCWQWQYPSCCLQCRAAAAAAAASPQTFVVPLLWQHLVNSRDLLDHLLDRYNKITPADIKECKRKTRTKAWCCCQDNMREYCTVRHES